jgi:hypothetical protein
VGAVVGTVDRWPVRRFRGTCGTRGGLGERKGNRTVVLIKCTAPGSCSGFGLAIGIMMINKPIAWLAMQWG